MEEIDTKLDDFYTTMMIQFSYVSLYHGVLPLCSTFVLLSNLVVIFITERMYSYITKRSLSKQLTGIGVLNDIFEILAVMCVIGAAFITTYSTNSLDEYFNNNKEYALLALLFAVISILFLRYLLAKLFDDLPGWLQQLMKQREKLN